MNLEPTRKRDQVVRNRVDHLILLDPVQNQTQPNKSQPSGGSEMEVIPRRILKEREREREKQSTVAGEVDEAGDHEHGMVIEFEFGLVAPGEAAAVVAHPEEDQAQGAVQQQLGQAQQTSEDAPVAVAHRHLQFSRSAACQNQNQTKG